MNFKKNKKQFVYTTCSESVLSLQFSCTELVIQRPICCHIVGQLCNAKIRASDRFTCTIKLLLDVCTTKIISFFQASVEHLEEHYSDLKGKGFFPGLIKYMNSGPVVPMVWEGLNVVKTGRVMLGETNPAASAPGTIRGDFSIQVPKLILENSFL